MAPVGRRDGSQLSGSRSPKERGAARNKAIAAGLKIESYVSWSWLRDTAVSILGCRTALLAMYQARCRRSSD
jgi:hypothetical protein